MVLSELTASAAALRSLRIGEDPTAKTASSASPLTNRTGESSNPFVRSFEASPVAWQPLDEETVERAKSEGKLLFLHIGYKACHCQYSNRYSSSLFLIIGLRLSPHVDRVIRKR